MSFFASVQDLRIVTYHTCWGQRVGADAWRLQVPALQAALRFQERSEAPSEKVSQKLRLWGLQPDFWFNWRVGEAPDGIWAWNAFTSFQWCKKSKVLPLTLWFLLERHVLFIGTHLFFDSVLFPVYEIDWINSQFWSTSRGTFDKNNLAPIAYTFVRLRPDLTVCQSSSSIQLCPVVSSFT